MLYCDDGSATLFHPDYRENYHNLTGAWVESTEIYGKVWNDFFPEIPVDFCVADVGLGLGYNFLLALSLLDKKSLKNSSIVSFEQELIPLDNLKKIPYPGEVAGYQDTLFSLCQNLEEQNFINQKVNSTNITIYLGDLRQKLKLLPDRSVFLWLWDPFSPAKNPEMWSLDLFRLVLQKSSTQAVLVTYSAAAQIRAALLRSKWHPITRPGIGKKKEITVALHPQRPLPTSSQKISLDEIEPQDRVTFRDRKLRDTREIILSRRLQTRARIRRILHP